MIPYIIIVILLFCVLAQSIYIYNIKRHAKDCLKVLRGIKKGEKQKIFTRNKRITADISYELNDIIETNQAQIVKLKKADEANKQILTSLSHDVRTPLASLLGYLEALNDGSVSDKEQREYISVAYRKANDLKAFIDMLFEWFKLNSKEQQFNLIKTDINELTREIIIEWLPVFQQKQVTFTININDEELLVSIDKIAYKRILNNLIQNAIKHGECTHINIAINKEINNVVIKIGNNGQVIPPEQLPYIFDRLYKCDIARSHKGSGLGLSIARELVTALNGKIFVSSSKGKDTVFSICFPIINDK